MDQMNLSNSPITTLDRAPVSDAQSQTDPQENGQKDPKGECAQVDTDRLQLTPLPTLDCSQTIIRPEPGACGFYVQRKKRFCRMIVKPGAQYCGEHQPLPVTEHELGMKPISQLRVPCPYDPKHTCFATKMERHLKICNSKPLAVLPDYLVPGVNSGDGRPLDEKQGKEKLTVSTVSDEKLINIIGQLMSTYKKYVEGQIKLEPLEHTVLEEELNKPEYGPSVLKHLIQNSSLLGQLDKSGLLENGNTFVEFGSGRGQLTYWLTKAVPDASTCQFVLVDRASHRHKFDNRLKDTEDVELVRLRVDIADLALGRVSPYITHQKENVVGISKHLCGAATDLSIRCLTQTMDEVESELGGILIALCCHHRCDWSPYVGKEFLTEQGFTEEDFDLLSSITSWCTCGSGKPRKQVEEQLAEHEVDSPDQPLPPQLPQNIHPRDRYTRLQLDQATREEIGRQAKRVLDYGRLKYLEEVTNLDIQLKYYVDPFISLENALIVCSRPGTTG